jgi:hypothetical protein
MTDLELGAEPLVQKERRDNLSNPHSGYPWVIPAYLIGLKVAPPPRFELGTHGLGIPLSVG